MERFSFEQACDYTKSHLYSMMFDFNAPHERATSTFLLQSVWDFTDVHEPLVVCNETNNTSEVVDSNGYAVDVYVRKHLGAPVTKVSFRLSQSAVTLEELVPS